MVCFYETVPVEGVAILVPILMVVAAYGVLLRRSCNCCVPECSSHAGRVDTEYEAALRPVEFNRKRLFPISIDMN